MKSSDKIRILICGNYGASNLGDEIILSGLLQLMKSAYKNTRITVMSVNPAETEKMHKVKAVKLFPAGFRSTFNFWLTGKFVKTISALQHADLIVLGGGGLFSDEKPRAVWIWYLQYLWFKAFRKKVACLAQSVGPLKNKWAKKIVNNVFKNAVLATVRDDKSANLLEQIGVSGVKVLADPAYGIAYNQESFSKKSNYIVLTLRPWEKERDLAVNAIIKKFSDWLTREHNLEVVFVPFQTRFDSDLERFECLKNFVKLKNPEDINETLEITTRARAVLGMRLHSVILAVLTKTPFVALSYSKKVKDFADTVEMGEFVLDYNNFTLEQLKKVFEKTLKKREAIENTLEKQKLKNTYKFYDHEKYLQNLF